jgi:hypothetical protein
MQKSISEGYSFVSYLNILSITVFISILCNILVIVLTF